MRTLLFSSALIVLAAGCASEPEARPTHAQSDAASDATPDPVETGPPLAMVPPEVQFEIAWTRAVPRFQVGEAIPVALRFSSSQPDTHILDGATYDRSGRLDLDRFIVTPGDDVVDPLEAYFGRGRGMIGGGLRATPTLGSKPHEVIRDLNEHLRFDRPGRYTLQIESSRLENPVPQQPYVTMTSNTLEFEVVEVDPTWATRQHDAARAAFVSGDDEAIQKAARALRYLADGPSVRLMTEHFDALNPSLHAMFGLIGAADHAQTLAIMNAHLVAPDAGVSDTFVHTLAVVASEDAPPPPDGADDAARWKHYEESRRATTLEIVARLVASLPGKSPAARAVCLQALSELRPYLSSTSAEPEAFDGLDQALAASFDALPEPQQRRLLDQRWRRIAGPEMLAQLHALRLRPDTSTGLRAIALRRIAQLDPAEGRALILQEMQAPSIPWVEFQILIDALPAGPIPALDGALITQLETPSAGQSRERAATLLARYGSAAIAERARVAHESISSQLGERAEAALLAYFFRVDPTHAARTLEARLAQTAPLRPHLLLELARLLDAPNPDFEAIAIEQLQATESLRAADAARALGEAGSAASIPAMMRRLERWRDVWSDDPAPLNAGHREISEQVVRELDLEEALWRSLTNARRWVLDPETGQRVAALCVSKHAIDQVRFSVGWSTNDPVPVQVWLMESGAISGSVGHFREENLAALQRRLTQFPDDVTFSINVSGGTSEENAALRSELMGEE